MLPILVTALCLLAYKHSQTNASLDATREYQPSLKVMLPSLVPEPLNVSATTMYKHNLDQPLSTAEYQSTMLKPSLFEVPQLSLPELFLLAVRQPHLMNAYQQRFGANLWQICAIDSAYGNIYLSLMLTDYGKPFEGAKVLISYDGEILESLIEQTQAAQVARFGWVVFHNDKFVPHQDVLTFFLGDVNHPYPISHYLT